MTAKTIIRFGPQSVLMQVWYYSHNWKDSTSLRFVNNVVLKKKKVLRDAAEKVDHGSNNKKGHAKDIMILW